MKKGMVHIYYGIGKGKTTAALGVILRALNYNLKVALIKFFKTRNISGEDKVLKEFKNVRLICSRYPHPRFMKNPEQNKMKSFENQKLLFEKAVKILQAKYDIVILDEVLDIIKENIISTKDMINLMTSKKENIELILTGHYINESLINNADLVTQMTSIKHYYSKGIPPRQGIEF